MEQGTTTSVCTQDCADISVRDWPEEQNQYYVSSTHCVVCLRVCVCFTVRMCFIYIKEILLEILSCVMLTLV